MNSCLAMCLLYGLTGQAAHFGEVLEVDEKGNGIVTSHCGCGPPSLAADPAQIAVTPVRLWNRGSCIRFPAKAGPATYVNIVGRRGTYRLCAVEGEAVVTKMVFEGNPVKIVMDMPVLDFLEVVNREGFGHHWMLGYARVVTPLRYFCRMASLRGVFPG